MRKVNALVRYEFTNIKRGKLIWVIAILYAIGIEQSIASMFTFGSNYLSLVGLIKVSWLPLNFIMIPIMILAMIVGESDDDIFKAMDIAPIETMLGKVLTIAIIDGVVLVANIIIATAIALICKVSISYFLYQMLGYVVNTVILLLVSSSIGLFIGQVIVSRVGAVVSFITIIILFMLLSNFYKIYNIIVPLFDIRTRANSFDVISYDKSYLYHNIFWIIISIILTILIYELKFSIKEDKKARILRISMITASIAVCIYLGLNIYSMKPAFYENRTITDMKEREFIEKKEIVFDKDNSDYYINKYNMNVSIDKKFKNYCSMEVIINKNSIDTVKLRLYEGLVISSVKVDENSSNFVREGNSFVIKLPQKYNKGDKIMVAVEYSGTINTTWVNGEELFFAGSNGLFLAHTFEWYPKQSDKYIKDYKIDLMYSGKNKVYSNLNQESQLEKYRMEGKAKEIFLISGHLEERKYKGYTFIGNEEVINNNVYCESAINELKSRSYENIEKIIFSPSVPSKMTSEGHGTTFVKEIGE